MVARIAALAFSFMSLAAGSAHATPVALPTMRVGDTWTFQNSHQQGSGFRQNVTQATVVRVSPTYFVLSVVQPDSTTAPVERITQLDWSLEKSVDGMNTVVNRPLNFPLEQGKQWDLNFIEHDPAHLVKSRAWHDHYTATGWEDVQTPAGTFRALKVEMDGEWTQEMAPSTAAVAVTEADGSGVGAAVQNRRLAARTASGRAYMAFWYVPEVKRMVKTQQDYYGSDGVRSERWASVLQSFKLATP